MRRITEEFVWKYCERVMHYWGTNGDFVGNYWETRLAGVRNSRGHYRELVGNREDFSAESMWQYWGIPAALFGS